ncbi:hypothetical protein KY290_008192 [Solanum tuberosum]|uniref:SWIM-type domain-containing protein n=1 Tax=Solanum tuberosum TaxID=4113 RepID=A0ABQ7W7N7_SOLTU|nr:hypothetical protein KY290_008192 [Solanum tuberosum]
MHPIIETIFTKVHRNQNGNFEHNVMVALYWGGEIITEMNGFSGQHGFHMNLLSQNYGFATISQPHFVEPIIPPSFQQLSMHDHRPFGEGSSSQRHFDSSHMEYESRTLENEEDIFMSTCESEMEHCSVWSEDTKKGLKKVDGTHMYGKYDIKLLIAVGINGNDNILPLAFAIVDKESKEAWKWFFRNLSAHVIKNREGICVISDRAKGILTSLQELRRFQEPRVFHRFCIRHLKSNFQSRFPNRDLSRLMWRASSAHQVRKFESLMWQIKEENVEAYEYLMEIPLEKWTVSYDDGKRWGVLTTNLSESSQIAQQLQEQNELWTERFKIKWEKNYESSKRHFVFDWNIPTGVYEVRSIEVDGTGGNPHCVSLNERKCDCGKWANLHFPCSHVMKVTDRMGELARNFVSEHFTIDNYVATYSGSFSPVGHEAYWPSPSFRMRSNEFYRRPNRSRTTRIPNEMDCGPTVYERACGLCRQTGHDRRRCLDRN